MIKFFNPEVADKPITNFNDIIKYILHSQTAGFSCDTQFEADMLNYIIHHDSFGDEVYKPGKYWWADGSGYTHEDDIES